MFSKYLLIEERFGSLRERRCILSVHYYYYYYYYYFIVIIIIIRIIIRIIVIIIIIVIMRIKYSDQQNTEYDR